MEPREKTLPHLLERVVEFAQDVVLVEDLALVAVLIVVVDLLPHVCRKLVEGHVLLHLLVLGTTSKGDVSNRCIYPLKAPYNAKCALSVSSDNNMCPSPLGSSIFDFFCLLHISKSVCSKKKTQADLVIIPL